MYTYIHIHIYIYIHISVYIYIYIYSIYIQYTYILALPAERIIVYGKSLRTAPTIDLYNIRIYFIYNTFSRHAPAEYVWYMQYICILREREREREREISAASLCSGIRQHTSAYVARGVEQRAQRRCYPPERIILNGKSVAPHLPTLRAALSSFTNRPLPQLLVHLQTDLYRSS
jgi:hypothetical protein